LRYFKLLAHELISYRYSLILLSLLFFLLLFLLGRSPQKKQKSATVTENGDSRRIRRQSHFSATNCRTFLQHCGQALRFHRFKWDRDEI